LIEQDGFPNSAETDHEDALGRTTRPDPLDRDANLLAKSVSASKLGWAGSRTGGEGIADRIHDPDL
jgi:hypothetical protein